MESSLDPKLVEGKIMICDCGNNLGIAKGVVIKEAGGIRMILINCISDDECISSTANPTTTIAFKRIVVRVKPTLVVAFFFDRRPNSFSPKILKLDLIAPWVNILAMWTNAMGLTGLCGGAPQVDAPEVEFNGDLIDDDDHDEPHGQPTTRGGNGLDMDRNDRYPTGHQNLDWAMDPDLVYNLGGQAQDYMAFLCALGYGPNAIHVITHASVSCPAKWLVAVNLNYPLISVVFNGIVGGAQSEMVVRPEKLDFMVQVKKRSFVVMVTRTKEGNGVDRGVNYGYLLVFDIKLG
ncbi:subtilisin-like protease SBT1.6 [Elaeis guineensis]|uniref:subtilisin-like protease SBT1.6 n=1 Tax=Elaeis guineensis var. tenera TaxID=51953 RepID=UPI003C6CD642